MLLNWLQTRLLFPAPKTPRERPYPFRRPFEATMIAVDGAKLAAVRFPVEVARGTVLFFHGSGQRLEKCEYVARMFEPLRMEVFAYDYRGYGKSTGRIRSEEELHRDASTVYRHLTQTMGRDPQRVLVYGLSIGTGLAVRLAAERPCGGVLLESPYFSMRDLLGRRYPWLPSFLLAYPLRSDLWIGKIRAPVALSHGMQDPVISYDSSERLTSQISAPRRLVLFPQGRHGDLMMQPGYAAALAEVVQDWPNP